MERWPWARPKIRREGSGYRARAARKVRTLRARLEMQRFRGKLARDNPAVREFLRLEASARVEAGLAAEASVGGAGAEVAEDPRSGEALSAALKELKRSWVRSV